MGRSLEKMLGLMVEPDPRMFVFREEGDLGWREVRIDKSADCYTYDPGGDLPVPKQWGSALRAKMVSHCSVFLSWTDKRLVGSVNLDLLLLVIGAYAKNGARAALTFIAVACNDVDRVARHFGAQCPATAPSHPCHFFLLYSPPKSNGASGDPGTALKRRTVNVDEAPASIQSQHRPH
jgi:hypothetical protein